VDLEAYLKTGLCYAPATIGKKVAASSGSDIDRYFFIRKLLNHISNIRTILLFWWEIQRRLHRIFFRKVAYTRIKAHVSLIIIVLLTKMQNYLL
jgi:hypothetical protein